MWEHDQTALQFGHNAVVMWSRCRRCTQTRFSSQKELNQHAERSDYQRDFGRSVSVGHHIRLYFHVSVVLAASPIHP